MNMCHEPKIIRYTVSWTTKQLSNRLYPPLMNRRTRMSSILHFQIQERPRSSQTLRNEPDPHIPSGKHGGSQTLCTIEQHNEGSFAETGTNRRRGSRERRRRPWSAGPRGRPPGAGGRRWRAWAWRRGRRAARAVTTGASKTTSPPPSLSLSGFPGRGKKGAKLPMRAEPWRFLGSDGTGAAWDSRSAVESTRRRWIQRF